MFQIVPYTKLEVGKKYKIIGHYDEYKGIYKGFEQGRYFNLVFTIRNYGDVSFSIHKDFYEFIPQAQMNMERRAVNLVLRRLIGDTHFVW